MLDLEAIDEMLHEVSALRAERDLAKGNDEVWYTADDKWKDAQWDLAKQVPGLVAEVKHLREQLNEAGWLESRR